MTIPTSFEAIVFPNFFSVLSSSAKREDCKIAQVYTNASELGLKIQLVLQCLAIAAENGWLALPVHRDCALYVLSWVSSPLPCTIKSASKDSFSWQQMTSLGNVGSPLTQWRVLITKPSSCHLQPKMSCAFFYFLFNRLDFIILNYALYAGGARWDGLAKRAGHDDVLLPIFCYLSEFIATGIRIVRPRPVHPLLFKLNEEVCKCMQPSFQNLPVSLAIADRVVVFIELSWPDIRRSASKRRPETFCAGSRHEKKRVRLSEDENVALSLRCAFASINEMRDHR